MNSSVVALLTLSVMIALVTGQHYRNSDGLPGRGPFYRKRNDYYEQPSRDYPRDESQDIRGDYDGQGNQDEYDESVGPVHTFVKTDEHAHFKWGVRHHIG